jgi:RimJ/RimL family protein N-acetyltransferase
MHQQLIMSQRLTLCPLDLDDDEFIFALLNDPAWLKYIGDKGITDLHQARQYIQHEPLAMFAKHGFGLMRVELAAQGTAIGLCGLLKRPQLPWADLGFAYLPAFRQQGFAYEAAAALLADARQRLHLEDIGAVTSPDNERSIALLGRLGFDFIQTRQFPGQAQLTNIYLNKFVH